MSRLGRDLAVALVVAACWAGGVGAARAEVRLHADARGRVQVQVSPGVIGTWRPNGPADAAVLNPEGDLQGDGPPAWVLASDRRTVVLSWTRPPEGRAWAALGSESGWSTLSLPDAQGAVGTPRLARLEGGTLVAWQELGPGRQVETALALIDESRLEALAILRETGELLGLWTVQGTPWLVLRVPGETQDELVAFVGPETPAEPIEWDRFTLQFLERDLRLGVLDLSDEKDQGARQAVALYWWTDDGSLSLVALSDDGDSLAGEVEVFPDEGRGSPEARLQQALRTLR